MEKKQGANHVKINKKIPMTNEVIKTKTMACWILDALLYKTIPPRFPPFIISYCPRVIKVVRTPRSKYSQYSDASKMMTGCDFEWALAVWDSLESEEY